MRRMILIIGMVSAALFAAAPAQADRLHAGLAAFKHRNYVKAVQLLWLPAEQGNSAAQAVLCFLHTAGYGVPRSYDDAAEWCERAANQGNVQAQYMLGMLYNKGHGVPEDYILAYKWLNLAASRAAGPKKDYSYRIRDAVATKMSPAQIERAQALSMEWRPIPEARYVLDRAR